MKWVEVLNEAIGWCDLETASRLVQRHQGQTGIRPAALTAADHARVVADAALLRRAFASMYLQQPFPDDDHQAMLQWLSAVTPTIATPSVAATDRRADVTLRLVGQRRANRLPAPFEAALTTAVLQFLATVSETLLFESVHRCQGIRRAVALPLLPLQVEILFAERAGLRTLLAALTAATEASPQSQCAHLIFSQRGRRFCSKACSNANFAARKAQQEPQYFAAKQERYRSRQQQPETNATDPGRGAFVYMDQT
jgi:hypothetical protein